MHVEELPARSLSRDSGTSSCVGSRLRQFLCHAKGMTSARPAASLRALGATRPQHRSQRCDGRHVRELDARTTIDRPLPSVVTPRP